MAVDGFGLKSFGLIFNSRILCRFSLLASVVESEGEASHVVEYSHSLASPSSNQEILLHFAGGYARMHRLCTPESLDTISASNAANAAPHTQSDADTIRINASGDNYFCVTSQWIVDSYRYGEWMREQDYALSESSVETGAVSVMEVELDALNSGQRQRGTKKANLEMEPLADPTLMNILFHPVVAESFTSSTAPMDAVWVYRLLME